MNDETTRLVMASANPHKAAEIEAILIGDLGSLITIVERPKDLGDVEETGITLIENARIKAAAVLEATGIAAVADDTGLEVAALDGAPGVYSARYAGEHASYTQNVTKLLEALGTTSNRSARFRTIAIALFPDGTEIIAEGEVLGSIATSPRGSAGFGYDPVFIPDEGENLTFAEMGEAEKHRISHRGRAFRELADQLRRRSN